MTDIDTLLLFITSVREWHATSAPMAPARVPADARAGSHPRVAAGFLTFLQAIGKFARHARPMRAGSRIHPGSRCGHGQCAGWRAVWRASRHCGIRSNQRPV
ncbi:hypothetical protein [Burkholderia ubonensis]|uniref:hypothetical protein n=1 Tax=Burkholderia ubonensis TaxID=101571 RepID=UPI0012F756C3|nr:hypothetical protein [Burkholderia ubonensis]